MIPPIIPARRNSGRRAIGQRKSGDGTASIAIPPPRYRIVERGRRLEVIDTQAGERTPGTRASQPAPDTRAGEPTRPPTPTGMLARGTMPRTLAAPVGEMGTRLALLWTAIVVVAVLAVVLANVAGIGAVVALVAVLASLYGKHRVAIRRWIDSLG